MKYLNDVQVMFLLCKVIKHEVSNPVKAQMYLAPLITLRDSLTPSQKSACRVICSPAIKAWKTRGVRSSTDCIVKDAAHVLGSSVMAQPHSLLNVVEFKSTLSLRGVEL